MTVPDAAQERNGWMDSDYLDFKKSLQQDSPQKHTLRHKKKTTMES